MKLGNALKKPLTLERWSDETVFWACLKLADAKRFDCQTLNCEKSKLNSLDCQPNAVPPRT